MKPRFSKNLRKRIKTPKKITYNDYTGQNFEIFFPNLYCFIKELEFATLLASFSV